MKKRIAFLVLSVLLTAAIAAGALVGCAGLTAPPESSDAASSAPEATPEPTEDPLPPVAAVVGKNVSDSFLAGMRSDGLDVITVDGIEEVDSLGEVNAIVLYLDSEEKNLTALSQAMARGVPVVVYNLCGQTLPDGAVTVDYDGEGALDIAFEAMLTYPPHDTPVRLFAVLEDQAETNPAFARWTEGANAGKVLGKAVYSADNADVSVANWIDAELQTYYPGMADAVFAETPDLAVEIVQKLVELQRDDLEVFTVGTNAELTALAKANPRILPMLVGANDEEAGAFCADAVQKLLAGQQVESITLKAEAVMQDLAKADDPGVSDGALEADAAASSSPEPSPEGSPEATAEAAPTEDIGPTPEAEE